ncbi:MAG: VOC family protein [Rikenellaceae bacterium]
MKITSKLDHININVLDLERSIAFYSEALGLTELRRLKGEDGAFELVYLVDGQQNVALELTWLADHTDPYELGDNETHLCFRVSGDYDQIREFHRSKGWVCYENFDMGLYFINDPDDYWIEILPAK